MTNQAVRRDVDRVVARDLKWAVGGAMDWVFSAADMCRAVNSAVDQAVNRAVIGAVHDAAIPNGAWSKAVNPAVDLDLSLRVVNAGDQVVYQSVNEVIFYGRVPHPGLAIYLGVVG